jgi:hypothetical protein
MYGLTAELRPEPGKIPEWALKRAVILAKTINMQKLALEMKSENYDHWLIRASQDSSIARPLGVRLEIAGTCHHH